MSGAFDAGSLRARYAFIGDCPDSLFDAVVTLPLGSLPERVIGVRAWRDALLAGRLPPSETWPPAEVAEPVRRALDELGLARFCKGQPELVDTLMKDVLAAFLGQNELIRSEVASRLSELEVLARIRLEEDEKRLAQQEKRRVHAIQLDEITLQRLRAQADTEIAQRERGSNGSLIETWGEQSRAWAAITNVFGDLGTMLGRGWDLTRGILRHTGWRDLLRLRELIEQLPQVREIVQSLGRLHDSNQGESIAETILAPVRRLEEERLETRTPLIPAETRGVERSGEIARMLPVEASMLGHPKLRLLWHSRRAERALMTYRIEGIEIERVWIEREAHEEIEGKRPRPERGPILAVIDTSGSMHGLPEKVAKALVLEAVRTAHAEKRRCFLYAYSGQGQVLEQELDLAPEGVGRLLSFLGISFGGGNDEMGVMEKVIHRLQEQDWKKADVIFVSDGEWPVPPRLVSLTRQAREDGTRFHGVQIGNRGHTGMHDLCDPVHVFQDWLALSSNNRR